MPNGQMPDANQMKMAAEMMKNMKPEQMESMMKMASQMAPMMGGMRAYLCCFRDVPGVPLSTRNMTYIPRAKQ